LHHCKSQASVNNGSYNQGSYYRNAKVAAALVHPLTVRAVEVLHVQLTSDTHLIVATSLGLIVYSSACLKLQRRPIVDQQCNLSACIHIDW